VAAEFRTPWGAQVVVLGGDRVTSVREWIAELGRAIPPGGAGPVGALLLDFRSHDFGPSADEASALAERLHAVLGDGGPPLAVVARPGAQFGGTRVLCTLAEMRGCRAAAFETEAEAWLWLRSQIRPSADPASGEGGAGGGEQSRGDAVSGGGA